MSRVSTAEAQRVRRESKEFSALRSVCFCVCLLFVAGAALAQGPQPPAPEAAHANELLKEGAQAFKRKDYAAAIELFQKAAEADPGSVKAHVYLATARAFTYVPGDASEENAARARKSIAEFRAALDLDSTNLAALDGLGTMLFHLAQQPYDQQKLMEARSFHYRHTQLKPDDAEPHYWVGLIDWVISFHANSALRADYNQNSNPALPPADPLPAPLVDQFRDQYGWLVDDGIVHMKKAIALRAGYDDALAGLNLLYRQKADQSGSPEERAGYFQIADELVRQVKELKQRNVVSPTSP